MFKIECECCGARVEATMMYATDHALIHIQEDVYFRKEFGDSPIRIPIGFKPVTEDM